MQSLLSKCYLLLAPQYRHHPYAPPEGTIDYLSSADYEDVTFGKAPCTSCPIVPIQRNCPLVKKLIV
jgi:hypothetical protein